MKIRIQRWPGTYCCPWKTLIIFATDWAFMAISGITLDAYLKYEGLARIVIVQEAFMVAETSGSFILLVWRLFLDKPNITHGIGLFLALFVLIFRVATTGFGTENSLLNPIFQESKWVHLAENIVLIVHIIAWAVLCEFSIVIDTDKIKNKCRKMTCRSRKQVEREAEPAKEDHVDDTASTTSSLPSYYSESLPAYTAAGEPVTINLPSVYEMGRIEEDEDEEEGTGRVANRNTISYPLRQYPVKNTVILGFFLHISVERRASNEEHELA